MSAILTFLLPVGSLQAADFTATPQGFDFWLVNLLFVLGIIYMIVQLWRALRPQPPYDQKFSAANHTHNDLLPVKNFERDRVASFNQRMREIKLIAADQEKLEKKLQDVQRQIHNDYRELTCQLNAHIRSLEKSAEQRASRLHNRIDPMAEAIRSNQDMLNSHLNDHRRQTHGG